MNRSTRGHGFAIWTIAWILVIGVILVIGGVNTSQCDRTLSKFCDIGWFIAMVLAAGALVIWLLGMIVGAVMSRLMGPSAPRVPPARRHAVRHRSRAYRSRRPPAG